ncbi:hypothetical protein [Bacillus sp. KH172YL63]|uniref:hypothetical protein n=1 Tax=Bacillus sp. KH172YL63 TaxID=2709784 RepID=UPI0013E4FC96|nr:hypothetical protein [Bacillus sp. KH172YL63]BCB05155.1 hypothetical protein KH172YL63_32880 [Bacillus sp. KH172YL63]
MSIQKHLLKIFKWILIKLKLILIWIKSNKDLMVSLTSLTLSIVTIFIMKSTNEIMVTTNKIMETQIEVEKADKLPIINFEGSYKEDRSGFAYGEIITIHNEGGILKDFFSEEITSIEIQVLDYSKNKEQIIIEIPVNDYYDSAFATGSLQKKIITYDNLTSENGNNKRRFEVINNFLEKAETYSELRRNDSNRAFSISAPIFKTYFFVSYKDIYNQKHENYYIVDHFGAKIIEKSVGEEKFSSELNQFINLNDINENMLLELIEKRLGVL